MTWEQRYRLRQLARTSLVLWAAVALVAALFTARGVLWLDGETGWHLYRFSPDGARAVLGTLVSSMLTFIVFVLSTTLIVVQLASGQLTPRVIALVLAAPGVKVALAALTFTYAYTLAALGRVEDRVPDLHVGIAVGLNLLCIVVFFEFVQRLSVGLRPGSLLLSIADRTRAVINDVYPTAFDPSRPEEQPRAVLPAAAPRAVEFEGRSGVVMAVGLADLVRIAREADAVVELVPQVGDSITGGDPLFRVFGGRGGVATRRLRGCVAVGSERTLDQDPRFAFRMLVDIANKALSPAINDPTTAVLVLDQIDNLLRWLGARRLDEGFTRDASGAVRVVYGTPDWPDYVTLAVSEIRQYGEGSLQVSRRLRALLEHLIAVLPPARHAALRQELEMLDSAVARKFPDEEDRRRANVSDYQGVGGSDA
ncbi:DUF2254 domain-containing protein [Gemmata sp.]|uniref:DUF2254 domain-containing protein n=1 Tax=Gemmata sp. TaxID=1914242 RepID=UPI003F70A3E1